MNVVNPLFLLSAVGLILLLAALYLFEKGTFRGREFVLSLMISTLLILSLPLYQVIQAVKDFFGIFYSFVAGFFFAILLLMLMNFYVLIRLNQMNDEIIELWQEISMLSRKSNEDD